MVYVYQADDALTHLCWKDRTTGTVEDDLIIFPGMYKNFLYFLKICLVM